MESGDCRLAPSVVLHYKFVHRKFTSVLLKIWGQQYHMLVRAAKFPGSATDACVFSLYSSLWMRYQKAHQNWNIKRKNQGVGRSQIQYRFDVQIMQFDSGSKISFFLSFIVSKLYCFNRLSSAYLVQRIHQIEIFIKFVIFTIWTESRRKEHKLNKTTIWKISLCHFCCEPHLCESRSH